jgi:Sucrase/ferredoxin-like
MHPAERPSCSSVARALGEGLEWTASRRRFWLMIEQPGPWGHDALAESGFPPEVGARLRVQGDGLGLRVLLIKRRDRPERGPRRCFAAFTGRRDRAMRTFDIDDPGELLELDLRALVRGRFRGLGTPVEGPLFLVCTHGKHDPCCARHGGPLTRALLGVAGEHWECTHVGGDRFAGNLVCFPHGLYFGRVPAGHARSVAEAYARGIIALDYYRGRSSFEPAVQAAEHHLRKAGNLDGVEDLVLAGHRRDGDVHTVDFLARDVPHTVEVEEMWAHERPLTCKSLLPHRPRHYVLRRLERRPPGEGLGD